MLATITVVYWVNVTNLIVVDQSPQDSGSSDKLRSSKRRSGDLPGEPKCLFCTKIDTP